MKTRVIVAVILLPLLLAVVLFAPKFCTAIVFGLLAAIASFELLTATGMVKSVRLQCYCGISAFWCVLWGGLSIGYPWLLLGIILFWIVLFGEMMVSQMKLSFEKVVACFFAGVVMPLMFGSVVRIHNAENGRAFILIPFVLAFLSDTGAYFAGLYLGKHKLAPTISPKKTVEGVVGGVLSAVAGMLLYCLVMEAFFGLEANYIYGVLYGVAGAAVGVFGDLCFSVIKRQNDIKDYGNLLPGHGGALDRFDSMMLIGPVAEVLLLLLPVAVK